MDNRYIVENTKQAIIERFGSRDKCKDAVAIDTCCNGILSIKKELKELKNTKQECASRFKSIDKKADPDDFAEAKAQMQKISLRLKDAEQTRKKLETQLTQYFEDQEPEKPAFPERFSNATASNPAGETQPIVFSLAKDEDEIAWNNFVLNHSKANSTHQFGWKEVFEKTFGHSSWMIQARVNNTLVGIFPVCYMSSKVFGTFAVSQPFLNYGGPLANSHAIEQALINYAWQLAQEQQCSHLEVRTCNPYFASPSVSKKVSMILSMPRSESELDEQLGSKIRAQYKQTQQHNPVFIAGGVELLNDFYAVFSRNMRDLGTPVYSKKLFNEILNAFPTQATIVVVKIKSKPVACAFLLGYKNMLEIPWASTLKEANKLNVNMWMYRKILGLCIQKGYEYFDFGRSTKNAGTYKFKKQWGAKPIDHFWYYLQPEGETLPEINPDNPKYKLAISIWKKIPVFVTKIIGPPIVKNIP